MGIALIRRFRLTMWGKAAFLAGVVGFISIIYAVDAHFFGGYGGGYHGINAFHSLHLSTSNISVLCTAKGGSCVASGTCATATTHFGAYYTTALQGAACNTTFTCCLPSTALVVHRFHYGGGFHSHGGGYGRRRFRSRGYGRRRSRFGGYGRRSYGGYRGGFSW